MTWNAFHNRGEVLRAVIRTADRQSDGTLPMQLPGVAENFHDELDLLSALMLKWHARLSGNIERALAGQPLDLRLAVATAWRRTAEEMPGVRLIIDRCTADPADARMAQAVRRAQDREWIRLAHAAGLANDESAAAARAGRRVHEQARSLDTAAVAPVAAVEATAPPERRCAESASLVERIKAVLAA